MVSVSILAAIQLTTGLPMPPPPPPVANEPIIEAAIESAVLCVDAEDGGGRANQATKALKAPIGTRDWNKARAIVVAYLNRREITRRCIGQLETLRYSMPMSDHDRSVLTNTEAGLVKSWLEQNAYAIAINGRLIGASVGSNVPTSIGPAR